MEINDSCYATLKGTEIDVKNWAVVFLCSHDNSYSPSVYNKFICNNTNSESSSGMWASSIQCFVRKLHFPAETLQWGLKKQLSHMMLFHSHDLATERTPAHPVVVYLANQVSLRTITPPVCLTVGLWQLCFTSLHLSLSTCEPAVIFLMLLFCWFVTLTCKAHPPSDFCLLPYFVGDSWWSHALAQ